jgi:hypothetical protein
MQANAEKLTMTMNIRIWWQSWGESALKVLACAGSLASLVALLLMFFPAEPPWWAIVLIVFAAFCFLVFILLELVARRTCRVFAKSDTDGIKRYMHDLIEHGGRVAVWTRDMSWARNEDTRELLKKKAARGELILCLPEQNDLAKELTVAGAEVCAYGVEQLELPASRFTITFFGRDGARVAVGRADGDSHVIDEFNAGGHPAFHLAEDLIALVSSH